MQNISICNKCQGVKWLDDNKQVVRDAVRVGVMGECGIPLSFCTRFDSHQSFIGNIRICFACHSTITGGQTTLTKSTQGYSVLRQIGIECVEHLHIIGTLEGGRLGHCALAHAAFHRGDRLVLVLLHPCL
jgi:hypothetical protein